jgi:hypothetical protein
LFAGLKSPVYFLGWFLKTRAALEPLELCLWARKRSNGNMLYRVVAVFSFCGGFGTLAEPGFFVPLVRWGFILRVSLAQKRAELMSWEKHGA